MLSRGAGVLAPLLSLGQGSDASAPHQTFSGVRVPSAQGTDVWEGEGQDGVALSAQLPPGGVSSVLERTWC